MKKIYLSLLIFTIGIASIQAQYDTLLYNGFQEEFETLIFPNGNDTVWINLDEDGLANSSATTPQDWYITDYWGQDSVPVGVDTNLVAASSSWLAGLIDGNRNWLITPPIYIDDDLASLHWKSAPYQGFRYMDGYSVYISTASNDPSTGDFGNPIFRAAQMVPPVSDSSQAPLVNQTVEDWNFSEGYIHADGFTLTDYFTGDIYNESIYTPFLEPHSMNLSAYEGQTIYIAFLHDSDDDNFMILDDILVLGTDVSVATKELKDKVSFVTYPNPATHIVNVLYKLDNSAVVNLYITDMQGKMVREILSKEQLPAGDQLNRLIVADLANGAYNIVLSIDDNTYVKSFVKN